MYIPKNTIKYSSQMTYALGVALSSQDSFRVGAIITDRKGNVLSQAVNQMTKTHPMQALYAWKADSSAKIYLHAEIASIIRCRTTEPYKLYVARVLKNGKPAMSKPCSVCQLAIEESPVQAVYYLDENGEEQKMEVGK